MTIKYVEVPMNSTKKTLAQLEKAVGVVAALRLQLGLVKGEYEAECARSAQGHHVHGDGNPEAVAGGGGASQGEDARLCHGAGADPAG